MTDELWSDGVYTTRSALGDVTNLVGKRGFSLISTSGDGHKKDAGSRSGKKECPRTENRKRESFQKETVDCVLRPHSLKGIAIASISKVSCETVEPCTPGVRENVNSDTAVGSTVRDGCFSIQPSDRGVPDDRTSKEPVETIIRMDDDNGIPSDNLDISKENHLNCSRLLKSQESRSCGLEKCTGQKGDGCLSTGIDSFKACSCSFCMKAAYIWSDLHYQDIKGRIAVLKKSQKEASILVQQSRRDQKGNFDKFLKLESDLTDQWMSLFLSMEDVFAREGSQLESNLSTVKGLRDSSKIDLDEMHSENH